MYSNICYIAALIYVLIMCGNVYGDYGKAADTRQVFNYVLWFVGAITWMIWGAVIDAI